MIHHFWVLYNTPALQLTRLDQIYLGIGEIFFVAPILCLILIAYCMWLNKKEK